MIIDIDSAGPIAEAMISP